MKAAVLDQSDFSIRIEQIAIPVPKRGEVLIKIKAASLNHHELWTLKEKKQYGDFRIVPGAAGDVVELGADCDKTWLGKKVVINPSRNWGSSKSVYGSDFEILGYPHNGTFAEFVAIEEQYVYEIPSHLSYEEAAALPLAGLTAYRALFTKGELNRKSKILITGIGGGVALWALFFALKMDAKVYVTSGKDDKIKRARQAGASGGVNYKNENWKNELADQADNFDLILDGAAGEGFEILLHLVKSGGRIVNFGRTAGLFPAVNPKLLFSKQITIVGTTMGSDDEFRSMLYYILYHKLRPLIDSVYELDQIQAAFKRMEDSEQFGKIILRI
ncbi:NADPH:quinone reductase [Dyadobacter koreensis]|uniref:NADPH:quinone reductase n=1 Tax=Dyadobacter koreensis TaxID=408657 RepID=A0A1H6Z1C5_9BACT|nr:zinc-binding dehydrogenase [Dyadobacter koreensis]SEJ43402.1 NADPH:quinone reductase [Dyadobacter koreensis]